MVMVRIAEVAIIIMMTATVFMDSVGKVSTNIHNKYSDWDYDDGHGQSGP